MVLLHPQWTSSYGPSIRIPMVCNILPIDHLHSLPIRPSTRNGHRHLHLGWVRIDHLHPQWTSSYGPSIRIPMVCNILPIPILHSLPIRPSNRNGHRHLHWGWVRIDHLHLQWTSSYGPSIRIPMVCNILP